MAYCVSNGYTVKESVDIVETLCMKNPLYLFEAIEPHMYTTEEAYDNQIKDEIDKIFNNLDIFNVNLPKSFQLTDYIERLTNEIEIVNSLKFDKKIPLILFLNNCY
mgnify:CR=1 FL=1